MKRYFKNYLNLKSDIDPIEVRKNLTKEIVKNGDFSIKTLEYKDIDESFKNWVENDLEIISDGKKFPTISLFSNQRFSEYMQSWENTDDDNNIMLNFKTVTRELSPKGGQLMKGAFNIPDERFYTMNKVEAMDNSGKKYFILYKMKQPVPIDLKYSLSIVTNRIEKINEFNQLINKKFKASQCYIRPNGHYISLKLDNISDESEYNISDRQFFSQTYQITALAYIITEDDIRIEEVPSVTAICFEGDEKKSNPSVEIIEDECEKKEFIYEKPMSLYIEFGTCDSEIVNFTIDTDFKAYDFESTNIKDNLIKVWVNGDKYDGTLKTIVLKENDEVEIKIKRIFPYRASYLKIYGTDPNTKYDIREETVETQSDFNHYGEDIEII